MPTVAHFINWDHTHTNDRIPVMFTIKQRIIDVRYRQQIPIFGFIYSFFAYRTYKIQTRRFVYLSAVHPHVWSATPTCNIYWRSTPRCVQQATPDAATYRNNTALSITYMSVKQIINYLKGGRNKYKQIREWLMMSNFLFKILQVSSVTLHHSLGSLSSDRYTDSSFSRKVRISAFSCKFLYFLFKKVRSSSSCLCPLRLLEGSSYTMRDNPLTPPSFYCM